MSGLMILRSFLRLQRLPRIPINGAGKAEVFKKFAAEHINKSEACVCVSRSFSSTTISEIKAAEIEREKGKKKEKTIEIPKILLLLDSEKRSVVTLEEANKIAKKRSMKLVEVTEAENTFKMKNKQVYKLVSSAQLLGDDKWKSDSVDDQKEKSKEIKTAILKSTTSDNDTMSKIKSIKKWVEKGHTVRVFISKIGDKGNAEHVYDQVQEGLKDTHVRICQKVVKNSEIRFQVMPPKEIKPKQTNNKIKIEEPTERTNYDL